MGKQAKLKAMRKEERESQKKRKKHFKLPQIRSAQTAQNARLSWKDPALRYSAARINLLVMIGLSCLYAVLSAFDLEILFLPRSIFVDLIIRAFLDSAPAVGFVFAGLALAAYLLCWLMSKKHFSWLVVALVLFIIDIGIMGFTILFLIANKGLHASYPIVFMYQILVLVGLCIGISAARQIKRKRL